MLLHLWGRGRIMHFALRMMTEQLSTIGKGNNIMTNLNIYERLNYGQPVSHDELLEALAELIAWREMAEASSAPGFYESPEDFGRYVSGLEEQACECNNEEHANFDDYKEFFDDCVYALPKHWPCAEPWDMDLRSVITEIIEKSGE